MSTPISQLRNLGPAMEKAFSEAGIKSAEELREIGTDEAYRRLLASGAKPHFIGFYVIEMALQGRPWNDCRGAEKDALRARFDQIKSEAINPNLSALEKMLDEIGVRKKA